MTRAYGTLQYDNGQWIVSDLEPHAVMRLKSLFPRICKTSRGPFVFGADPAACADLNWFMQRYPLTGAGPDELGLLASAVDRFEQLQAAAERLKAEDWRPQWAGARWKPGCGARPHQAAAAEMLELFGGLMVGDDTGLGKTYTVMAACMLPGALPATIVCDPHKQLEFVSDFQRNTTLAMHRVKQTSPYALPACDVRVFSWTQLAGWSDMLPLMGHGLVAGDEMQELRTATVSQRGTSARPLFDLARYRLGATATPIYNYGDEIWNVMSYLRPDLLGPLDEFRREWCTPFKNGKYKVVNPKALGAYLRDQHAFVRKRKPRDRVNRIVRVVPHDAGVLASFEDVARALARTAATGTFHERGEATRKLDMKLRQWTGIAKAPAVAALVRMIVEAGEPVLVGVWHREVYDILRAQLADLEPAMFSGSETAAKKAREKERFSSGATDVCLISLRSGRGSNGFQDRCRLAVIAELDWSPEVHKQLIGRLDREGSVIDDTDGTIDVIFAVADDGSDPVLMEINGLKASQAAGIVDPDLGIQMARSEIDGLRKLIERYLPAGEVAPEVVAASLPSGEGGRPDAADDEGSVAA